MGTPLQTEELAEKGKAVIAKVAESALIDTVIFRDTVTFVIDRDHAHAIIAALKTDAALALNHLSDVNAVDYLEQGRTPRFDVVYHLASLDHGHRLRLRCPVGEEAEECWIDSICDLWSGASFMERETWDMFGITFKNLPDPRRILMPENWQGHPLRKDHPLGGATSYYFKQDTDEYAGEPDDLVPRIRVQDRDI